MGPPGGLPYAVDFHNCYYFLRKTVGFVIWRSSILLSGGVRRGEVGTKNEHTSNEIIVASKCPLFFAATVNILSVKIGGDDPLSKNCGASYTAKVCANHD